jgi:hypothetical protein
MIKKIIMNKNFEKQKIILENFYRCRDLELNNLWQKSVFLGTLLVLCFTGYGILILLMIKGEVKENMLLEYNILCFFLCFISAIFSVLWIYMFKGSKAHYELYERAITDFEEKKLGIEKEFIMGRFNYNAPIDECIFSTNGGKYSPSRINIFIGQMSLFLWILAGLVHFYNISNYDLIEKIQNLISISFIFLVIFLFFFSFFILRFINGKVKSSYLTTKGKEMNHII